MQGRSHGELCISVVVPARSFRASSADLPAGQPSLAVLRTDSWRLQDKINLEEIIERLLDVRNGRPGKQVQLTEQEIKQLCLTSKEIFMQQPNLLELEAPIKICGKHTGGL